MKDGFLCFETTEIWIVHTYICTGVYEKMGMSTEGTDALHIPIDTYSMLLSDRKAVEIQSTILHLRAHVVTNSRTHI